MSRTEVVGAPRRLCGLELVAVGAAEAVGLVLDYAERGLDLADALRLAQARACQAFVTFYKGQTKAFETTPLPVSEGLNNRIKTVPLRFSLALDKQAHGEHRRD